MALTCLVKMLMIYSIHANDCEKGKAKACLNSYRNILSPTVRYIRPLCGLSVQGRMKGEDSRAALTDEMGHLLKKKRRLAGGFCEMLIRRNDPPPSPAPDLALCEPRDCVNVRKTHDVMKGGLPKRNALKYS